MVLTKSNFDKEGFELVEEIEDRERPIYRLRFGSCLFQ